MPIKSCVICWVSLGRRNAQGFDWVTLRKGCEKLLSGS